MTIELRRLVGLAAAFLAACGGSSSAPPQPAGPPAAPALTALDPGPAAMTTGPRLRGTAPAASTVSVFADPTCASTLATGSAAAFASPGITVAVPAGLTTSLYGVAVASGGLRSSCASLGTFTSTVPTLLGTSPASPAQSTLPLVLGTADAGATVAIYGGASCAGLLLGSGTAAELASPGIAAAVVADTPATLSAAATLSGWAPSGCSSTSVTYLADQTPPAPPALVAFLPGTSAMTTGPRVQGDAEAGAAVAVYATADCSGAPLASGSSTAFFSPGFAVTVTPGAATTLHATATDVAGNPSGCATLGTFTSTLPVLLTSTPVSPSNSSRTPSIGGMADAGSAVALYADPTCTGAAVGSGLATGAGTYSVAVSSALAANATTTLRAQATVPGWDASGCSTSTLAYAHDAGELAPTITASTPASPYTGAGPYVSLRGTTSNVEVAASTVSLYADDPTCTTAVWGSGTQAAFTGAGITVPLFANATTAYYARSTDAAGNASACTGPFTFTAAGACAAGVLSAQVFSGLAQGCAGAVSFADRASLCAPGAHPCSADEWVALGGGVTPAHDLWLDDPLRSSTGTGPCGAGACASGACFATLATGVSTACAGGGAMLVCSPVQPDPEGNTCTWTGCGHDSPSPSASLGGCATTAGTLCCAGPTVRWVSAATGSDANDGTAASPLKTLTKGLSLSGMSDTVRALPGTYDAANGESFPLAVPAGVFLVGDEANRGAGATPTLISGTPASYLVALGGGAVLAGFDVVASGGSGVFLSGSGATVRNCTLAASSYAIQVGTGVGYRVLLDTSIGAWAALLMAPSASVKAENDTFTGGAYGIVALGSGVDLGGGALSSVGNNVLSCNASADVWVSGGATISADFNRWDHAPPTFSSASPGGGVDIYAPTGSVVTTGGALASPTCP